MGYFTWTDARRNPKILKNGNYTQSDIIRYDGYAKIVCPDDTEIIEKCYEGYGIFDGHDIYELVVDWNKQHLENIFNRMLKDDPNCWGSNLKNLAVFYQNGDTVNIETEIKRLINSGEQMPFFEKEWKRTIGIAIACEEKNNRQLPFPIKITATKWKKTYDELVPSCICQ